MITNARRILAVQTLTEVFRAPVTKGSTVQLVKISTSAPLCWITVQIMPCVLTLKVPLIVPVIQVSRVMAFFALISTSVKPKSIIAHPWPSVRTSLAPLTASAVDLSIGKILSFRKLSDSFHRISKSQN